MTKQKLTGSCLRTLAVCYGMLSQPRCYESFGSRFWFFLKLQRFQIYPAPAFEPPQDLGMPKPGLNDLQSLDFLQVPTEGYAMLYIARHQGYMVHKSKAPTAVFLCPWWAFAYLRCHPLHCAVFRSRTQTWVFLIRRNGSKCQNLERPWELHLDFEDILSAIGWSCQCHPKLM